MNTLVDALLAHPPATRAALSNRIAPHTHAAVRAATVARILTGHLSERQTDALPLLFRLLGVGAERDRLTRLLLDATAPHPRRTMAMAALFHDLEAQPLIDGLDPRQRIGLGDAWLRPLVRLAAEDVEAGDALADMLVVTRPPWQGHLLAQLERLRAQLGVSAMAVYDRALLRPALVGWWPRMIELVLQSPDPPPTPAPENVVPLFGRP